MAGNENSGRLPFQVTDEHREKVMVLRAGGMTLAAICEVIGVTEVTLRKHFAHELDIAQAKVKSDLILARYASAMSGNVNAQNRMIEQISADVAETQFKNRSNARPNKKVKLGKKEEQQIAARSVGGKFAPPSPPKLVVDNK